MNNEWFNYLEFENYLRNLELFEKDFFKLDRIQTAREIFTDFIEAQKEKAEINGNDSNDV